MKKRIISFALVIASVLSVLCISTGAASIDFFSEKNLRHAENIVKAMRNFEDEYSFGDDRITKEELNCIVQIVNYNYPDIFILTENNSYSYKYYTDNATGETIITKLKLEYTVDRKTYERIVDDVIEPWVESVVSLTNSSFSELEYAVFFHDYLCANYSYDNTLRIHSLHEFITEGTGVCQSYMYAYMALLRRVGVEVTWICSEDMNHAWNQVKIDGEWYNVDATWDDPKNNTTGAANHGFLLKSDAAFTGNEKNPHYNWISANKCTSTKYDSVDFGGSRSPFAFLKGKWYYISNGDLYVTDSPDVAGNCIRDFDNIWFVWGSTSRYYTSSYSCLLAYEGRLYLNTPKTIIRVNPDGADEVVSEYNGDDGYIYGMAVDLGEGGVNGAAFRAGRVKVAVTTSPDAQGNLIDYKLPAYYAADAGDVNGDGKLNLKDASLLMKYIAKWDVTVDMTHADFDENGKVNVTDVSKALKRIAGWY